MAIVRNLNNSENFHTYLATVALFFGLSCTILMLKFRGFKASLDLLSGKTSNRKNRYELAPTVSVSGAYRSSRDEYLDNKNNLDYPKQPASTTVRLPPNILIAESLKPSKSTSDLSMGNNAPAELRKSVPNVTVISVPSTRDVKDQLREQNKLEKKRMAEQKEKQRLAAKERERQEILHAQQQAKLAKERDKQRKKKTVAPQPQQNKPTPQQRKNLPQQSATVAKQSRAPPPPHFEMMGQPSQSNANRQSQNPVQYTTNTLESSISRSSGPPPYSEAVVPNNNDNSGNTSFAKPVADTSSSWDMVTQHRRQISRTPAANNNKSQHKQMHLQYNVGNITKEDADNTEA